jgi:nicotinamidase-related amidase
MSRQALLIVDMQRGLFGEPRAETGELVARLNALAARVRAKGLPVIFIQHCGDEGHELHPSQPGHALHLDLMIEPQDLVITKKSCDAFLDTTLAAALSEHQADEVIVTGCATDFCVDTTIRSALARGYATTVPKDGHTTFDRPNLSTQQVIEHHNMIWANFTSPIGPAILTRCDAII